MDEKVCVATYGINFNKPEFIQQIIALIQEWDATEKNPIVFNLEYGLLIHLAQEACVIKAISEQCSHILFTEDDTTYIPKGSLRRLLDYDLDVVGAYAYSRHYPHYSMIFNKAEKQKHLPWLSELLPKTILIDPDDGLRKVDMLPYQFTLIKTSVFSKIRSPWFFYDTRSERLTDFWFADRCFEAGIEMHCDTDLIVKHGDIDGITAGFHVQKEMARGWGGIQQNWKSGAVIPIMKHAGFDTSNEAHEKLRQRKGY